MPTHFLSWGHNSINMELAFLYRAWRRMGWIFLKEHTLSFQSSLYFLKISNSRETTSSLQKLHPFLKWWQNLSSTFTSFHCKNKQKKDLSWVIWVYSILYCLLSEPAQDKTYNKTCYQHRQISLCICPV